MTPNHDYLPVFDGHNDTLLNLYMPDRGQNRSFFERSENGHIDLPRARDGGLGGGFFAMFVPAPKSNETAKFDKEPPEQPYLVSPSAVDMLYAQEVTAGLIDLILRLEEESAGQFKVIRTSGELAACLEDGVLAAVMHFEGAECIQPDLSNLATYYDMGLRSLGLTWSRPNAFANGVPFGFPHLPDTGPGLTEAGKQLVSECNRLGIMLDLSHLNEKGFWDVAHLSSAPLVATHSAVHELCPSTRNLTDKQLKAVGDSGGVVGINFHKGFLRADGDGQADTSLTEIVKHLDYVVEQTGIDHVALGSDFDGAKMPDDLGDVSGLPRLLNALRAAGYDEPALKKIAYENWQRLLSETWKA